MFRKVPLGLSPLGQPKMNEINPRHVNVNVELVLKSAVRFPLSQRVKLVPTNLDLGRDSSRLQRMASDVDRYSAFCPFRLHRSYSLP
jgi:hypothetical protein